MVSHIVWPLNSSCNNVQLQVFEGVSEVSSVVSIVVWVVLKGSYEWQDLHYVHSCVLNGFWTYGDIDRVSVVIGALISWRIAGKCQMHFAFVFVGDLGVKYYSK